MTQTAIRLISDAPITRLTDELKAPPAGHVAAAMHALMGSGFRLPPQIALDRVPFEYGDVLATHPVGAIDRVVRKLRYGKYPVCETGFVPIPAVFSRLCDEERAEIVKEIAAERGSDKRRMAIGNTLPDHWTLRDKEREIDRILSEIDAKAGAA